MRENKIKIRVREMTYWELLGRRGRTREVDVKGHGAGKSRTVMLEALVVSVEHLGAANFLWFVG